MTGRTYRKKGKQTFPNWTVPKRHGRLISSHAVPSIAFTMPSGLDMPAVNRCTTSVGCKTLRPRVSHRLHTSWANGDWFYTIPPLLTQPTIWPQPWDVGSARIRPEERIDGYKLSLGFGTAYYYAPNRPSTRKMQAWLTSIPTAKGWCSNFQQPMAVLDSRCPLGPSI